MRRALVCVMAVVVLVTTALASAQSEPPSLTGTWKGKVTADIGEMPIVLTVTATGSKAAGELQTGHGILKIKQGTLEKGVWTLTFAMDDGPGGVMKGKVVQDTFSGDWDFKPMAVGTFSMTRQKK